MLLSAPLVAFILAMAATLLKVNIQMPASLYPIVSTFLLLGIGMKVGRELFAEIEPLHVGTLKKLSASKM